MQGSSQGASEGNGVGSEGVLQQESDPPMGPDSTGQLVRMAGGDQMDYSMMQSEEVANTGSLRVGVAECRASPLASPPSSPPLPLLPKSSNPTSAGSKRTSTSAAQQEQGRCKKGSLRKKRRLSNRDATHRSGIEEDREEGQRAPLGDSG